MSYFKITNDFSIMPVLYIFKDRNTLTIESTLQDIDNLVVVKQVLK